MNKKFIFILFSFLAMNLYGQNLHFSGTFKNSIDSTVIFKFRGDPLTSERDEFITTLDKNGNFQFSMEIGLSYILNNKQHSPKDSFVLRSPKVDFSIQRQSNPL